MYRVNAGAVPATAWVRVPEAGGGRDYRRESCHFVDFLTFLAGGPPVSLTATALQAGGRPRHDVVSPDPAVPRRLAGDHPSYFADGDTTLPKEFIRGPRGEASAPNCLNFRSLKLHGEQRVPGLESYFRPGQGLCRGGAGFRRGTAEPGGPAARPVRGAVPRPAGPSLADPRAGRRDQSRL